MAGISAHQQTDHMPSTDEVFYIMLALLQFGVPAALPSFRKDPAVLVMFACSPKSQRWSIAALVPLLESCFLLEECHRVHCNLSMLMAWHETKHLGLVSERFSGSNTSTYLLFTCFCYKIIKDVFTGLKSHSFVLLIERVSTSH